MTRPMVLWYPDSGYHCLGGGPLRYKLLQVIEEQAQHKANRPPLFSLFEKCELGVSITATAVIWHHEIYRYFATGTGILTAGWASWAIAIPASIVLYAMWYRLTRRWRNWKALDEWFDRCYELTDKKWELYEQLFNMDCPHCYGTSLTGD